MKRIITFLALTTLFVSVYAADFNLTYSWDPGIITYEDTLATALTGSGVFMYGEAKVESGDTKCLVLKPTDFTLSTSYKIDEMYFFFPGVNEQLKNHAIVINDILEVQRYFIINSYISEMELWYRSYEVYGKNVRLIYENNEGTVTFYQSHDDDIYIDLGDRKQIQNDNSYNLIIEFYPGKH